MTYRQLIGHVETSLYTASSQDPEADKNAKLASWGPAAMSVGYMQHFQKVS
jgi:hypothetical protein